MGAKTGHNMEKDVSCLFHYFSVDLPLLVPGNLVLGGWAAIPHGKLGIGARNQGRGCLRAQVKSRNRGIYERNTHEVGAARRKLEGSCRRM